MLRSGGTEAPEGTSKMKDTLDTIDKVRSALGGLKTSQHFYEELLASLPQFVACGPQSAGKSSVIRRVSGVSLPESSTLCTRIATLIQMRRSSDTSIRVTLVGPSGETIMDDSFGDNEAAVRDAVAKAQETAINLAPNQQFVEHHSIIVHVAGPDRANVTLVDLPGFHTADDRDTKTVNDMVRRYIEMPGTLVLHVIKGDQDYASLLGNDFMRQSPEHSASRVTVLTHCDKVDPAVDADVNRLTTTLDTTTDNSTMTVAVLGCARNDGDERAKLQGLTEIDTRLEIGAEVLSGHLEDRMRVHLETQFPKAIVKLETSLADTIVKLDAVRERSPVEILCQMAQSLGENFRGQKRNLMNDLRSVLHEMTTDIKNFRLMPVASNISSAPPPDRDQFAEPLEPGQAVYYMYNDGKLTTSRRMTVKSVDGSSNVTLKSDDHSAGSDSDSDLGEAKASVAANASVEMSQTKVLCGEHCDIETMVKDIEQLAHDRGMRNCVHVDRHPIIACYAKKFAEHYTASVRVALGKILAKLTAFYDAVFSTGIAVTAKLAAERLREQMREEEKGAAHVAGLTVHAMSAHNTDPDLLFSSNEHYLNSLVQQMVATDKEMASDSGGARHIFHGVRAFVKVQRKYISEMASKELIRTTIIDTETRFGRLITSNLGVLAELVKEPTKTAYDRQTLTTRKQVLEEALALVR